MPSLGRYAQSATAGQRLTFTARHADEAIDRLAPLVRDKIRA
jgi:hypothetical protein